MAASLHHPHVISVLDYGFDAEQQPYFTMNLLVKPRNILQAAKGKPLAFSVGLLIQMLEALVYMHRRGIVHRDLKPDNTLVTTDDEVKILDFGLAMLRENQPMDDLLMGTFAYMAPEVLTGGYISEAVDLYAVGMMAYQMFVGAHPFAVDRPSQLIQDIIFTPVDMSDIDINPSLAAIISRLLRKQPQERFESAYDVIAALSEAFGQSIPAETTAIRESFLSAAQFVGRETEMKLLSDALAEALEGRGSTWLIGGESGVGKSRFINEMRIRALVRGALVLQGRGVVEGGLPYHAWRDPLRRLALSTALSDFDAGVLRQIVPDMSDLLGRPIPEVSELQGQAGQQRLLQAIVDVFRRQKQPIVLVLEDLQWMEESLEVLRALIPLTETLPLLVLADYRDDEKPNIPQTLSGAHVLKLERLTDDALLQLSTSMLGEAGSRPELIDLLKRETEGNVFFLVEVVRALAEDVGRLADIGKQELPRQVFAGGIQQAIQRRLDRVPRSALPALRMGAVIGRQIDLRLLAAMLPALTAQQWDDWLALCTNAAVIEAVNEQWQFAHDKLREGLLATMTSDERRSLHQQAAEALQSVHAAAVEAYAAVIGDHYEQAGVLLEAGRWYARAGEHAQKTYAPEMATSAYRKALRYLPQSDDYARSRLEVLEGLGAMLNWQAQYDEAVAILTDARELARSTGDTKSEAQAWLGICTAQIYQGDFAGATRSAEAAEAIARAAGLRLKIAQAVFVKGWNAFRTGDTETALAIGAEVIAICEELDAKPLMAQCLNMLGGVHYTLGDYQQAGAMFGRASEILQDLGDRSQAMALVNNVGAVADARGDYETAYRGYQEALHMAREIGLRDAEMLYLSNLGGASLHLGLLDDAEFHLRRVITMAETSGFGQLSETYRFLAETLLGLNEIEQAQEAAVRGLELAREVESAEFLAAVWRVLGQIAAQQHLPIRINRTNGESAEHDAEACFAESLRISDETGMEGERARTLKAWAQCELERGNRTRGQDMWREAQTVFERIGAQLEAERMAAVPGAPD